jgi:DNA-damage-inducible protein J
MASHSTVRARVDEQVKVRAAKILAERGLSVSDAIRLLLTRVAIDKELPFDIGVPNAQTRAAMAEMESGEGEAFDRIGDFMADLNAEN